MTAIQDKQALLDLIRRTEPKRIAEELLSVQPMPPVDWNQLAEAFAMLRQASGHRCAMCRPMSEAP